MCESSDSSRLVILLYRLFNAFGIPHYSLAVVALFHPEPFSGCPLLYHRKAF